MNLEPMRFNVFKFGHSIRVARVSDALRGLAKIICSLVKTKVGKTVAPCPSVSRLSSLFRRFKLKTISGCVFMPVQGSLVLSSALWCLAYPPCRLRWALRAATRMFPPPRPLSRDAPGFELKYSCADVWLHMSVYVCVLASRCVGFFFFQTLFLRSRGSNGDQSKEGEGTGERCSWWNYKRPPLCNRGLSLPWP